MGVTIVPNQKGVDELTMDQMLGKTGSKSSKKKKKIEEVLKDLGIPTVKEGSRTMSNKDRNTVEKMLSRNDGGMAMKTRVF